MGITIYYMTMSGSVLGPLSPHDHFSAASKGRVLVSGRSQQDVPQFEREVDLYHHKIDGSDVPIQAGSLAGKFTQMIQSLIRTYQTTQQLLEAQRGLAASSLQIQAARQTLDSVRQTLAQTVNFVLTGENRVPPLPMPVAAAGSAHPSPQPGMSSYSVIRPVSRGSVLLSADLESGTPRLFSALLDALRILGVQVDVSGLSDAALHRAQALCRSEDEFSKFFTVGEKTDEPQSGCASPEFDTDEEAAEQEAEAARTVELELMRSRQLAVEAADRAAALGVLPAMATPLSPRVPPLTIHELDSGETGVAAAAAAATVSAASVSPTAGSDGESDDDDDAAGVMSPGHARSWNVPRFASEQPLPTGDSLAARLRVPPLPLGGVGSVVGAAAAAAAGTSDSQSQRPLFTASAIHLELPDSSPAVAPPLSHHRAPLTLREIGGGGTLPPPPPPPQPLVTASSGAVLVGAGADPFAIPPRASTLSLPSPTLPSSPDVFRADVSWPFRVYTLAPLGRGVVGMRNVGAIVNAANSSMRGGSFVDWAIHTAAGPNLLVYEARLTLTCPAGQAIATPSFNLASSQGVPFIIHAVAPNRSSQGTERDNAPRLLAEAYFNALVVAHTLNLESVAFCGLGEGVFAGMDHVDRHQFITKQIPAIKQYAFDQFVARSGGTSLKRIYFVPFDDDSDLREYDANQAKAAS